MLTDKLKDKSARLGVIGLGYVGLPLAVEFARAGFQVTGAVATLSGDGEPGNSDSPGRFNEPAGITALGGKLYVADTNNHLIRVIDLKNGNRVSTLKVEGLTPAAK